MSRGTHESGGIGRPYTPGTARTRRGRMRRAEERLARVACVQILEAGRVIPSSRRTLGRRG